MASTVPEEERSLQEELSLPIILADRVIKSAQEAESSKAECSDLARHVDRLSQMLRSAVRICSSSSTAVYDRPARRIAADVVKNLDRALALARRCRHSGVLRQVFSISTTADFRKVLNLLESSTGDMKWLLSIFDADGSNMSLPPIASNDPIMAWVWSGIATLQMGQIKPRTDAANEIASLAKDNPRNKKIIVDEGGLPPLLKLLKEASSPDAQIAAANAIHNVVAGDRERVRALVEALGVPAIVQVLNDSPVRVQVSVVKLVSRMAELDSDAQEEFARENVNRPLVSLLAMDTVLEDPKIQSGKTSIHSIVQNQISKELTANASFSNPLHHHNNHHHSDGGSSRGGHYRKDRDSESLEVKLELKIGCAEALWKLCRGSLTNSRKVTETKGMICLAKIIEKEEGDLQLNCLLTVAEIAAVAESSSDLRRAAFKTNSPAAKAVLDQLLRVIQDINGPWLQIPAIESLGCLSRTFPARETRIVGPLVTRMGDLNADVATEAAAALAKFASPENFNCVEHSKAVIEFGGVPLVMRLVKIEGRARINGMRLLAYLALHVGNSKALEEARALTALESACRSVLAQNPEMRELLSKAIHHLALYQPGAHPHWQSYVP